MIKDLMYIELKTGHSDDGPAWIGYVKTSKTKKTIYFNDHAFQKYNGGYSNYVDIENGDEYWISGLKKRESNRHWAVLPQLSVIIVISHVPQLCFKQLPATSSIHCTFYHF